MDAIKNIFILCVLMGSVGLSFFLVVTAVLRWLAVEGKVRKKRLNILAGIAAVVLLVMLLASRWGALEGIFSPTAGGSAASDTTGVFIEIAKFAIKLLLLWIAVASVALISLIVALFLHHGLKAVIETVAQKDEPLTDRLKKINRNLIEAIKNPIFTASMTWGLLAFFIFLPLLVGNVDNGSVMESWKSGVIQIVEFEQENQTDSDQAEESKQENQSNSNQAEGSKQENQSDSTSGTNFHEALIKYILFAIIVLGVAFAAFKLLYSIISRTFKENRGRELIDEYSGAIGVLSVGVAVLWTLQGGKLTQLKDDPFKLVGEFFKAFAVVMIIVALIVLTLEIIRLLLDMREKLIRQEARLLFISLVGEVTLLMLFSLHSLYDAVNNALGNTNDHTLDHIEEEVKRKIVEAMDEQLSKSKEHERTFTAFDEVVTKEDEGEET